MSLSKPRIPFEPILESLSYLDRNELELISITSRFFNQVICHNFPSKPYRILLKEPEGIDVQLFAELNARGGITFELLTNPWASPPDWYDIKSNTWSRSVAPARRKYFYRLPEILTVLPKYIRIAVFTIYIGTDYCTFSPEDIRELESLAHVWDDRRMHIYFFNGIKNDPEKTQAVRSSADLILSSSNLMRCRHLIMNNHTGILLQPNTYPMLYKLRFLELSKAYADFILDFIRNKALYPESETILIVSAFRSAPDTLRSIQGDTNMFEQIRKDFITSSVPNNFTLLINFRYESETVTFGEFREKRNLENPRTKEVLQFAKSSTDDGGLWKKFGLSTAYPGYSSIERFSV
ncbi:hypothetical protein DdX_16778 [Ditylenchus destructor]|uniref:F-box domain-containing protein n=1 Tax=Ditylenchus destructor TaxID=166010 RepID=A0AAD4MMU0_9BILA|nr:hypothetical protein DdX_16778 [Ditylenchus destructor]